MTRASRRRDRAQAVEAATVQIVRAALDGEVDGSFALGFAAALDMAARGTLDLRNPIGMAVAAWRDVCEVGDARRAVTDVLRRACAVLAAGGAA